VDFCDALLAWPRRTVEGTGSGKSGEWWWVRVLPPPWHANLAFSGAYKAPLHGWCYPPICGTVLSSLHSYCKYGCVADPSESSSGGLWCNRPRFAMLRNRTVQGCILRSGSGTGGHHERSCYP
jgi:hypothetical protein